jgi:hypothetical protein
VRDDNTFGSIYAEVGADISAGITRSGRNKQAPRRPGEHSRRTKLIELLEIRKGLGFLKRREADCGGFGIPPMGRIRDAEQRLWREAVNSGAIDGGDSDPLFAG